MLTITEIEKVIATPDVRDPLGLRDRAIVERALAWIAKYMDVVRPELVVTASEQALFLTRLGDPFTPDALTDRVRKIVSESGVGKKGACHMFRHTAATLMLEGGADIRYVQQMLGHSKLETTEIYTHVSITKLREVYAATHPAAKLGRSPARRSLLVRIVPPHRMRPIFWLTSRTKPTRNAATDCLRRRDRHGVHFSDAHEHRTTACRHPRATSRRTTPDR